MVTIGDALVVLAITFVGYVIIAGSLYDRYH